jgi:hypothetical protein
VEGTVSYIALENESLREVIGRVRQAIPPVRWSWAATWDGEAWMPFALVVTAGEAFEAFEHVYPALRTSVEEIAPSEAARRLEAILPCLTEGYGDRGSDGLDHQVQRGGYWLTTERGTPISFYARPEWPEFYISLGSFPKARSEVTVNDGPLMAPSEPYFPHAVALLEQELTRLKVGNDQRFPPIIVLRLPNRLARFTDLSYADNQTLTVPFEVTERCRLNISWRVETASTQWTTQGEIVEPGGEPITLEFDALPVELWAVLQAADGAVLDRRGWDPHGGVKPADPETNFVRLACVVGENEHIEFKALLSANGGANEEFAESVAAFANCGGGTILLGINNRAQIVGFDPRGLVDTITQVIRANVFDYVSVQTTRVEIDGRPVWRVEVPDGSDKPYRCRDRIIIRAGATDRAATTTEIRRLSSPLAAAHRMGLLSIGGDV